MEKRFGRLLILSSSLAALASVALISPTSAADAAHASACSYPAGPYGLAKGDVLPPTLAWSGYAPGATAVTTLHTTDLFDCDGSKGINAIALDVAAEWCPDCQNEAPIVETDLEGSWGKDGVYALTLLVEDNEQNPASSASAREWIDAFGLTKFAVVADPKNTFGVDELPTNVLIDPRTMKIVSVKQGFNDKDQTPDTLAQSNMPKGT